MSESVYPAETRCRKERTFIWIVRVVQNSRRSEVLPWWCPKESRGEFDSLRTFPLQVDVEIEYGWRRGKRRGSHGRAYEKRREGSLLLCAVGFALLWAVGGSGQSHSCPPVSHCDWKEGGSFA
ncbi:hypothetical protein K456DRAFT_1125684 [Colletotrichum gloeosporioides 23]|nr:hypothetical protein K456DRAFT_1125684 [Colletotrichum gloeosporioides 23]